MIRRSGSLRRDKGEKQPRDSLESGGEETGGKGTRRVDTSDRRCGDWRSRTLTPAVPGVDVPSGPGGQEEEGAGIGGSSL